MPTTTSSLFTKTLPGGVLINTALDTNAFTAWTGSWTTKKGTWIQQPHNVLTGYTDSGSTAVLINPTLLNEYEIVSAFTYNGASSGSFAFLFFYEELTGSAMPQYFRIYLNPTGSTVLLQEISGSTTQNLQSNIITINSNHLYDAQIVVKTGSSVEFYMDDILYIRYTGSFDWTSGFPGIATYGNVLNISDTFTGSLSQWIQSTTGSSTITQSGSSVFVSYGSGEFAGLGSVIQFPITSYLGVYCECEVTSSDDIAELLSFGDVWRIYWRSGSVFLEAEQFTTHVMDAGFDTDLIIFAEIIDDQVYVSVNGNSGSAQLEANWVSGSQQVFLGNNDGTRSKSASVIEFKKVYTSLKVTSFEPYVFPIVPYQFDKPSGSLERIIDRFPDQFNLETGSNLYQVLDTLAKEIDRAAMIATGSYNPKFLEGAFDGSLDLFSVISDLTRNINESDDGYKARILRQIPEFLGGGTKAAIRRRLKRKFMLTFDPEIREAAEYDNNDYDQSNYAYSDYYGQFWAVIEPNISKPIAREVVQRYKSSGVVGNIIELGVAAGPSTSAHAFYERVPIFDNPILLRQSRTFSLTVDPSIVVLDNALLHIQNAGVINDLCRRATSFISCYVDGTFLGQVALSAEGSNPNLLTNGNFESGSLIGFWTVTGSGGIVSGSAYSGSYSFLSIPSVGEQNLSIHQKYSGSLINNVTYTFDGWHNISGYVSGRAYLVIEAYTNSGLFYRSTGSVIYTGSTNGYQYSKATYQFTGSGVTQLRFIAVMDQFPTGSFGMDEFRAHRDFDYGNFWFDLRSLFHTGTVEIHVVASPGIIEVEKIFFDISGKAIGVM